MKIIYTLLLVMIYVGNVMGQKEYNQWINGFGSGIDFNHNPPIPVTYPTGDFWIWRTDASICDTTGKLMFYTNGFRIFNRDYQIMQNGDSLNLGDYLTWGYDALYIPDGAVIIPYPGSSSKYFLFHTNADLLNISPYGELLVGTKLYYDVIDMSLDSGRGAVLPNQKEVLFLNDTLTNNGIEAVKHGNGKDWWLICHEYGSDRYYKFLVDQSGLHGPFSQNIGMIYKTIDATGIFGH